MGSAPAPVTDRDGHFHAHGLPAGPIEVRVHAYGYAWNLEEVVLVDGEAAWRELHLLPGQTVQLQVRDATGAPFRGEVQTFDTQGREVEGVDAYWNGDGSIHHLDLAGRAAVQGLPAGLVVLRIGWADRGWGDVDFGPPDFEQTGAPPPPFEHVLDLTRPVEELIEITLPYALPPAARGGRW